MESPTTEQTNTKKRAVNQLEFIWFIYNLLLHYIDFSLDILLCYYYYNTNKFQITLLFTILPNLLIILVSILYSSGQRSTEDCITMIEMKLNRACFFLATGCLNIQLMITLLIWLFVKLKNGKNKRELIELEYVVLIVNIFHVLFNNVPQLITQSVLFINGYQLKYLNLVQLIKIVICLIKTSWLSIKFVRYFLINEFNIEFKLSRIFILNKFISNIFTLILRLGPIVYLFNDHQIVCLLLLGAKILFCLVYTHFTMFLNKQLTVKLKLSCCALFWFFIVSFLRTVVFIDNFKLKSFLLFYILSENFVLVYLFSFYDFRKFVLICFLLFVINFLNIFNEYLLFKYCFSDRKLVFNDLFNSWLLEQQMELIEEMQVVASQSGPIKDDDERKVFLVN